MTNIISFKKKSLRVTGRSYLQCMTLEDGSFWYRFTDIRTGEWFEWVKMKYDV